MAVDRYVLVKEKNGFSTTHALPTLSDFDELVLSGFSDPVSRNPIVEEAIDQQSVASIAGGVFKASGTLEGTFRPMMLAPLLKSIFGIKTGYTTAVDTYRGIGGDQTGPSMTPAYKYTLGNVPGVFDMILGDDQAMKNTCYVNTAVNSIDLTMNTGDFVKAKFNWLASKAYVSDAIDAVTYNAADASTEDPLVFYNMSIRVGSSNIVAKSMTFNINRKFDEQYVFIGSPFLRGHWLNGMTTITGTMTFGGKEWTQLKQVMTGVTPDVNGGLDGAPNSLGKGTLEICLYGPNASGTAIGTPVGNECKAVFMSGVDALNFTEMNRSVQARNQFDKSVNFQVTTPSADSFYLLTN